MRPAGPNPRRATGPELQIASPPPAGNFEVAPVATPVATEEAYHGESAEDTIEVHGPGSVLDAGPRPVGR